MFITPAYAQATGDTGGGSYLTSMAPLILIFVIFYFLLIRPQQKRAKEHKLMVANLRRGDQVVTGGGILGKVTRVKDGDEIEVEIAEGTRVRIYRSSITGVLSRSEPAAEKPAAEKPAREQPVKAKPARKAPAKAKTTKARPAKARPAKDKPAKDKPTNDE